MAHTIKIRNLRGQLVDLDVHDCTRFDDGARPCAFCRVNFKIGSLAGQYVVPYDIPGFYEPDIHECAECGKAVCNDDDQPSLFRIRLWEVDDEAVVARADALFEEWLACLTLPGMVPVLHPPEPFA